MLAQATKIALACTARGLRQPHRCMLTAEPVPARSQAIRDGQGGLDFLSVNRLELTPPGADATARTKNVVADPARMDRLLVDRFLDDCREPPKEIWLDLDATDDPPHGHQEGRFCRGYCGHYGYLPLYLFSCGFCRKELMAWCEANGVDLLFGLTKNERLLALSQSARRQAQIDFLTCGEASRVFCEFSYQSRTSWSCARRVVGKAEHLAKSATPFVLPSLGAEVGDALALYEETSTAPTAIGRTALESSSSICSPSAPPPGACGQTRSAAGRPNRR